METALAIKEDAQISIVDIKKYIAPTATDKELFIFMGIAKAYGLNPLKREIHFVKRKTKNADGSWSEVGSSIVGYEVYLKRAERTQKLDGWKCWIEKDNIGEKAVIEIKRKDQSMPVRWEVYRKEFDTEKSTWGKMPTFMLKKVAIAQGFRLAFPDDLGGMPYIPEEMPHDKGGGTSETLPTAPVIEATVTSQHRYRHLPTTFLASIQSLTSLPLRQMKLWALSPTSNRRTGKPKASRGRCLP